ncbi:MAG TPA: hypothetical protein VKE41_23300 [Roseiflexaceae bacterium]|nr:hypothetical protein [Roseiflexaceae bacterium]
MVDQYHICPETQQLRTREVGEALAKLAPQPQACDHTTRTGSDGDPLVERVCWLMRREPMRERGREM